MLDEMLMSQLNEIGEQLFDAFRIASLADAALLNVHEVEQEKRVEGVEDIALELMRFLLIVQDLSHDADEVVCIGRRESQFVFVENHDGEIGGMSHQSDDGRGEGEVLICQQANASIVVGTTDDGAGSSWHIALEVACREIHFATIVDETEMSMCDNGEGVAGKCVIHVVGEECLIEPIFATEYFAVGFTIETDDIMKKFC